MRSLGLTLALLFTLSLLPGRGLAADETVHGLTLIPWAAKVDEDRYRSSRDFGSTVKWYHKLFSSNRHIKEYREVNLPGVKYVHFENRHPKAQWSGFNIYQKGARGEVRIYVLKKLPDAADKKAEKPKSSK